jgi:hypothetical protein
VLLGLPLEENSDDFLFDNQMLSQIVYFGYRIGEVSCPTRYFAEASSIPFWRASRYGMGCVATAIHFRAARLGLWQHRVFRRDGRRLSPPVYP